MAISIQGSESWPGRRRLLSPNWKKTKLSKDIPIVTAKGNISLKSVGTDSDALIQVLDELYQTKLTPKTMHDETPFTGISLEGDPGELSMGIAKIKLFHEKGGEEAYAEAFINIDLKAGKVELREKDPDYRQPLVRALMRK